MDLIFISRRLAESLDTLTGSKGSAYFEEEDGTVSTTIEHLQNLATELDLDFDQIYAELSLTHFEDLDAGVLANWSGFAHDLIVNEPVYKVLVTKVPDFPLIGYYLNQLVTLITSGLASEDPSLIVDTWQLLLLQIQTHFGTLVTSEDVLRWDSRVDRFRLPVAVKLTPPE